MSPHGLGVQGHSPLGVEKTGKDVTMRRCDHSGLHSGIGRYDPRFKAIRFVVVCDHCGAECREVQMEAYEPRYVADAPENRTHAA
jgi:hypothetical protein